MIVKIKDYPYRYKAFSLNVFSEIPVNGFTEITEDSADVYISLGNVPEKLNNPLNKGVLFEATENEFLLQINNIASVFIENGVTITICYKQGQEKEDLSSFIIGSVFGVLLHQRRLLPIHGSTVYYKNKTLTFSGISGAGKSTLAAEFLERGAHLISDDISLIDFSKGTAVIIPAFPGIKIWEDSLKKIGKKISKYKPLRNEMKKYLMPVKKFKDSEVPVNYIFILSSHNKNEFDSKEVTGIEKFNMLKNNTYFFKGLNKTGIVQNHFIMCNQLAKETSVFLLTRPTSGFRIKELADLVESLIKPD